MNSIESLYHAREYNSGGEAPYYHGKSKWEWLGKDAHATYATLDVPPIILVKPAGNNEAVAPTVKDGFRIDDEIAVYLSNVSKLSPKTHKTYRRSLALFRQSSKKIYVHQITKQDMQAFDTALIEKGDEDRTRHNRVQNVARVGSLSATC